MWKEEIGAISLLTETNSGLHSCLHKHKWFLTLVVNSSKTDPFNYMHVLRFKFVFSIR